MTVLSGECKDKGLPFNDLCLNPHKLCSQLHPSKVRSKTWVIFTNSCNIGIWISDFMTGKVKDSSAILHFMICSKTLWYHGHEISSTVNGYTCKTIHSAFIIQWKHFDACNYSYSFTCTHSFSRVYDTERLDSDCITDAIWSKNITVGSSNSIPGGGSVYKKKVVPKVWTKLGIIIILIRKHSWRHGRVEQLFVPGRRQQVNKMGSTISYNCFENFIAMKHT